MQISAKLISYSYCAHFRDFFEPIFQLSDGKVDVSYGLTEYGVIYPFKKFNTNNIPDWWKSYNHVKHEWFECIDEATLKNNIEALTGLFMLNILYKKRTQGTQAKRSQRLIHNFLVFLPKFYI